MEFETDFPIPMESQWPRTQVVCKSNRGLSHSHHAIVSVSLNLKIDFAGHRTVAVSSFFKSSFVQEIKEIE